MLDQLIAQANKAAALASAAASAVANVRGLRSGDRVWTPLIVSGEFMQGVSPSVNLIFNVPSDSDFWAYRLSFFAFAKVVDPVNGSPDERVYRPTSFVFQANAPGVQNPDSQYQDWPVSVDGTFALIFENQELQNIDIPLAATYNGDTGKWTVGSNAGGGGAQSQQWAAASENPGGMEFDIPFFIPRGSSLTCRLTPTYLGVRGIEETQLAEGEGVTITRRHQYKIVGLLEGEKKVNAFR